MDFVVVFDRAASGLFCLTSGVSTTSEETGASSRPLGVVRTVGSGFT